MFVIDGSGSMWGRFEADKRAKIDVVRELLSAKITAAAGQNIGLTSFGHRRKSDCSDVEVIAEPVSDPAPVLAPLAKLNPRGKGPLVTALRQAAGALTQSRPASMIVINDAADNCQQDACAAANEIAAATPGVAIHVVSIGVD
ncbi:MAG: VWA domain-containing protein, partial [Hyphomicrobium sp.]